MKLALAWLAATLVSVANADTLYNLTSAFSDDCAIFCTSTAVITDECADDSVACWCKSPDFLSDTGCCIAYMCDEDISYVRNTLDKWCAAASVPGPTANSTNCSYPYETGTSSTSSSGSSLTSSIAQTVYDNNTRYETSTGMTIGIPLGCVGAVILLALLLWRAIRKSREEDLLPTRRPATPPPPYSEEVPQIPQMDASKESPSASSCRVM
ncbi:uncharacterized protein N7458_001407 [Penicillium daleae]|uniref:CFEM domain-containing protein n=1 Tax=Penicillium daleae TaxID=63821 RepID=A0AAD6CAT3_9EURO|nr:uncharacterized protein N7458_001407 [Penicillium daleae]KAJ5459855.1 hypothetical protein N7458_001407 [Penicillium daleae]